MAVKEGATFWWTPARVDCILAIERFLEMLKHHFPVPRTSFLGAGCRWHRRTSLAQVYPRVDLYVHMRREEGVGDLPMYC